MLSFVLLTASYPMSKKWFFVSGLVLLGLIGGFFVFRDHFSSAQAKLEIVPTNVPASVYIEGKQVSAQTPYEEYRTPGEITLRLVPSSTDAPLAVWETRVTLAEGVTTVVRHDFGNSEQNSAGEILSFEKIGGKKAELAVVSVPDAAEVAFDGQTRGFSPLPIVNASSGEHTLAVSHPGYIAREIIGLKTVPGYKLTAVVFLAEDPTIRAKKEQEAASMSANASDEPKIIFVEIQDTGVGFLRVRAEASKTSDEVAQVTPGKQYLLLEESRDGEWYKIEYEKGKQGWVFSSWAKKVSS